LLNIQVRQKGFEIPDLFDVVSDPGLASPAVKDELSDEWVDNFPHPVMQTDSQAVAVEGPAPFSSNEYSISASGKPWMRGR
jgi:hypothetical protein